MPAPRAHSALVTAARLYYLEGMSQGDIAKSLEVSRSSVSRMLSDARERGIVEIRIHPDGPMARRRDLEQQLAQAAGLQELLVPARPNGRSAIDVVAEAAARLLEGRLASLGSLGVSWGATVAAIADQMVVEPIHHGLDLYPLVGGMPTMGTGPSGNEALGVLERKGAFRVHRFQAPAIVESEITWQALLGETSVRQAVTDASSVQAAVVGIGSMDVHASPHVVRAMHLSAEEHAAFMAQRPVGDICGQFYDAAGTVLGPPTARRVIGITVEQLANIPTVLGVAGGIEKARGVAGALRTGALDKRVVDDELAEAVLALLA